jgi:hypothetical protein
MCRGGGYFLGLRRGKPLSVRRSNAARASRLAGTPASNELSTQTSIIGEFRVRLQCSRLHPEWMRPHSCRCPSRLLSNSVHVLEAPGSRKPPAPQFTNPTGLSCGSANCLLAPANAKSRTQLPRPVIWSTEARPRVSLTVAPRTKFTLRPIFEMINQIFHSFREYINPWISLGFRARRVLPPGFGPSARRLTRPSSSRYTPVRSRPRRDP